MTETREPLQSASSVVVVQAPLAPVLESVEISVEE